MKPLKLTMSAFGPYSGETEIDFRTLGRSGVYLVCGDTGAGKTMIFDAICFALFGEASGDSRNGARSSASLRSDFADPASKTFVELEFSYRGQTYRVKRNPDYERAKKRGEGTTKEPANAEIELPDGRCIGGVRKVNMQVEELLGIDANQFKQIVMLAQGEFRKLLTADTATREGIFRKLFATQKYEMLQDRLGEECRKLERENEKLKSEVLRCAQTVRFAPQDARALFRGRDPEINRQVIRIAKIGVHAVGAFDDAYRPPRDGTYGAKRPPSAVPPRIGKRWTGKGLHHLLAEALIVDVAARFGIARRGAQCRRQEEVVHMHDGAFLLPEIGGEIRSERRFSRCGHAVDGEKNPSLVLAHGLRRRNQTKRARKGQPHDPVRWVIRRAVGLAVADCRIARRSIVPKVLPQHLCRKDKPSGPSRLLQQGELPF